MVEMQFDKYQKSLPTMLLIHSESPNTSAPTFTESVEHLTVSLVTEQKREGKRQLNFIIHKLDESPASDGPSIGLIMCPYKIQLYIWLYTSLQLSL